MKWFKKFIGAALILMICMINPLQSAAQAPGDPCTDPADPCPIDGGLVLLIAAGIAVAAKKAFDYNKQKQAPL